MERKNFIFLIENRIMIRYVLALTTLCFVFFSCSKDDSSSDEPEVLSNDKEIISFTLTLNNESVQGTIDENSKTINFNVVGATINALVPQITFSESATIFPLATSSQDFNNPVRYTITAENGSTNSYFVVVENRAVSEDNKISAFAMDLTGTVIEADIDQETKLITLNTGTFDIASIVPTISIPEYATISPGLEVQQDFNKPVSYTVTAENGDEATYRVVVNAPTIDRIATTFRTNPALLYTGSELIIEGFFLNMERPNATLYLTDGNDKYPLEIDEVFAYDAGQNRQINTLYAIVPDNVPTYDAYYISYEDDYFNITTSSTENLVDVVAEDVPNPTATNQSSYGFSDKLIITGENLPDMIAIPANGSIYLIESNNNYDLEVNDARTELKLTLDKDYLFYGSREEPKRIDMLGPNRRLGKPIEVQFH